MKIWHFALSLSMLVVLSCTPVQDVVSDGSENDPASTEKETASNPTNQTIAFREKELTLVLGEYVTLPVLNMKKAVTFSSSNPDVASIDNQGRVTTNAEGKTTITVNDGSSSDQCEISVVSFLVPDAIDLGLSVKWASFDLGDGSTASQSIYRWGEPVEPTGMKRWDNYVLGNYNKLLKYNNSTSNGKVIDNLTILEPEDDPASYHLKGNWRTPTIEEWNELFDNCDITTGNEPFRDWTPSIGLGTQSRPVVIFKSRINGNTINLSNRIFYKYGVGLFGDTRYHYWTANVNSDECREAVWMTIYANSETSEISYSFSSVSRGNYGTAVRPVSD